LANKIIASLKKSNSLKGLVNSLKSGHEIDRDGWDFKGITPILSSYIRVGWCKRSDNEVEQYEWLMQAVNHMEVTKREFLRTLFDRVDGLRQFLIMHSVFDLTSGKSNDWLVKFMRDYTQLTDEEVCDYMYKQELPEDVVNLLDIFGPECADVPTDDVTIRYGMWMKSSEGRPVDPIWVIDNIWDLVTEKQFDTVKFIEKFKVIKAVKKPLQAPVAVVADNCNWDDDLPF